MLPVSYSYPRQQQIGPEPRHLIAALRRSKGYIRLRIAEFFSPGAATAALFLRLAPETGPGETFVDKMRKYIALDLSLSL